MAQLQKFANNASGTLLAGIVAIDTTITLSSGHGAFFPTLTGSEYFVATLKDTTTGLLEIVKVLARTGDALTVVRGHEGTVALAFPAGSIFELRPTAGSFNAIYDEVDTTYFKKSGGTISGDTDFTSTGAIKVSTGTTAQRPVGGAGKFRFNSNLNQFEGHNGTDWGSIGAGATGGSGNAVFFENDITVTADYTITTGKNAMTAGPITINGGVTVTIPTGSAWTIV